MVNNAKKIKQKKNLFAILTAAITVIVLIVAYIAISNSSKVVAPGTGDNKDAVTTAEAFTSGPKNMVNDGIIIGEEFKVASKGEPTPAGTNFEASKYVERADGKTTVRIYLDPQCPDCKNFDELNSALLDEYIQEGKIVVDYHPISFLDRASTTKYSSRATNALACVADMDPNNFHSFLETLYVNQPKEGTDGLSNGEIYSLIEKAGVTTNTKLETCVYSNQFNPWVIETTDRVFGGDPLPETNSGVVEGTPTIFIDGEKLLVNPNDPTTFDFKTALDEAIAK